MGLSWPPPSLCAEAEAVRWLSTRRRTTSLCGIDAGVPRQDLAMTDAASVSRGLGRDDEERGHRDHDVEPRQLRPLEPVAAPVERDHGKDECREGHDRHLEAGEDE